MGLPIHYLIESPTYFYQLKFLARISATIMATGTVSDTIIVICINFLIL
jgi:hypothetical protein